MPQSLEATVQRMLDAGESEDAIASVIRADRTPGPGRAITEPTDFWSGVRHALIPGGASDIAAARGAGGYLKGAVNLPGALKGLYEAVRHPSRIGPGLRAMPEQIRRTVQMAGSQPEALGELLGEMTGQPLVTAGIARGVPRIPAGIRAAGGPVETAGRAMAEGTFGPVSSILPPIATPHALRTAEKLAGHGLKRAGQRMQTLGQPRIEPYAPSISAYGPGERPPAAPIIPADEAEELAQVVLRSQVPQVSIPGKAPTLESSLMDALENARQGTRPTRISGTPDITSTPGGPIPVEEGFRRGYTSGRPATRPEDALMRQMIDEGQFAGDRTIGQFREPSGGVTDLTTGRIPRYPLPTTRQPLPTDVMAALDESMRRPWTDISLEDVAAGTPNLFERIRALSSEPTRGLGAERIGQVLQSEFPEDLAGTAIERTGRVRAIRGGPAGLLPPAAQSRFDNILAGLSPEDAIRFAYSPAVTGNQAVMNYVWTKLGIR